MLKQARRIPKDDLVKIRRAIDGLLKEPCPAGSKQLSGMPFRSLRVGRYRVIYQVSADRIFITKIGQRQSVYKR